MDISINLSSMEREFAVIGDFTAADEDKFFDVFLQIKRMPEAQVIFNLSKCTFIDSAAMGMLIVACQEAVKRNITRIIRGASPEMQSLLVSAQFEKYFYFQ